MGHNQWDAQAYLYLEQQQYDQVAEIYESLLDADPTNLDHYWYLGLSYLLQQKENKAQLTWLIALNEQGEEGTEQCLLRLGEILEQEADRQVVETHYQLAWLIRGHLREVCPNNPSNLLQLILLNGKLGYAISDNFENWQVIDTITHSSEKDVPKDLIISALKAVLTQPYPESVAFTEACLGYQDYAQELIDEVILLADKAFYDISVHNFAIDLVNVCLKRQPNDLTLINKLYEFYAASQRRQETIDTALIFYEKSKNSSLPTHFLAIHQLLRERLLTENWPEVLKLMDEHLNLVNTLIENEQIKFETYQKSCFPGTSSFYQYTQDDPFFCRTIINQISALAERQFIVNEELFLKECSDIVPVKSNKLKIGYIGSTFYRHSVGWLCRWLIKHHDRENFEVYLYSLLKYADDFTKEYFIDRVDGFYSFDRSVLDAVKQIKRDGIDILIDLDGISSPISFRVMFLKPAPILVNWLGTDASGLSTVDYFIVDRHVISEEIEPLYKEKLWFLPQTYLGIDGFEVGIPTLTRQDLGIAPDEVIFMNIQTNFKRHPDILRLQFKILKQVENSHILVKAVENEDLEQNIFYKLADEEGVNYRRVHFLEKTKLEMEHRANLSLADVILDTYPYNGATTTLESLWMELPIVTKVGKQFTARNSYTFMTNAGITEGIAWTDEEYIEWGIKLGTDENLRKEISWKLRQAKKTSPLWNGKQFAREMENAYRQMWETYVEEKS